VEEVFVPLSHGGAVVLRSSEMTLSASGFLEACGRLGVTVMSCATAFWHQLVERMGAESLTVPGSVRLVIIGGEACKAGRVREWEGLVGGESGPRVVNA